MKVFINVTTYHAHDMKPEQEVYKFDEENWVEGLKDLKERLKLASYSVISAHKYNSREECFQDLLVIFKINPEKQKKEYNNLHSWVYEEQ
jgi:hypothetical protein